MGIVLVILVKLENMKMFEELLNRLTAILLSIEDDVSSDVIQELEDVIQSLEESKCSNGMFCGMDKKW